MHEKRNLQAILKSEGARKCGYIHPQIIDYVSFLYMDKCMYICVCVWINREQDRKQTHMSN